MHDATAFGEIQQVENLGFCAIGDGGPWSLSGAGALGGTLPVNPSGGLVSRGHPVSATGLAQIYELVAQLRGEAGARQVARARIATAENGGGLYGIESRRRSHHPGSNPMNAPLPTPQDSLHNAPGYAQLILTALRRRPDHLAFRWRDDGRERSLTYRATADMIERTAAALVCLRPAPGSAVALLTGPRPEAFVVMAAACLAGIRFAALHPLGNTENDAYVLRDSGAGLLIVDEARFAGRAAAARAVTEVVSLSALSDLVERTPPQRWTLSRKPAISSTPAAPPASPRA
ncbi:MULTISPECIES: AMP-binding protein [unclassified Streptomyces]|uniref:thiolase C-terminal domain-containing protein n=1 Tax=unclassified Streptomyces TaxID=2593676 RepID=UPI002256100B|nr:MULTISPECIES: AMP-binding protein [unclassified Streptomyces]MCX4398639.1 AMP-binding protein [Streptomyces sp. NBC_01767]WSP50945.1 AMP-binding protein [Streptomyces sp. NBC_01243]